MSYLRVEGNYVVLEIEEPNTHRRYGQAFSILDFTANHIQMIKQGHTCTGCRTFTVYGWDDSVLKHSWCSLSRHVAELQSCQKYHKYKDGHVIISYEEKTNDDDEDVAVICNRCELYKFECECNSREHMKNESSNDDEYRTSSDSFSGRDDK